MRRQEGVVGEILLLILSGIALVGAATQMATTAVEQVADTAIPSVEQKSVVEGEVIGIEYQRPVRGTFSGREGYWTITVAAEGQPYYIDYPDKPDLQVGQKVQLHIVRCRNPY